MATPQGTFEALKGERVTFFTGVPDSLLKDFCAYVTDHTEPGEHIIAANEGSSIALAAGHFIATGELALVYMQNSGFGNAMNPLLSLADPEVYAVPMVVLVGWRGEPGVKDEPQHVKQGRVMEALLKAMELPYAVLDGADDADAVVALACETARARQTPFVILARAGAFEPYTLQSALETTYPLNREGALQLLARELDPSFVIVSTTGKTSRELFELRAGRGEGHARDFLTVGAMGHASQIALGIALRRPRLGVYCLDGDGALLMHMGALAVIGTEAPANFKHVVINNGAHDSVGGQPTAAFRIDIPAIARASGYRMALRATTPEEIREGLRRLDVSEGPALLEVRVNKGARSDLGRPTSTPVANRDALMDFIRAGGREVLVTEPQGS